MKGKITYGVDWGYEDLVDATIYYFTALKSRPWYIRLGNWLKEKLNNLLK